ncbi:MAG: argininosuccinate lyase, partial [Methyloceanibacter sp.]
GDLTPDVRAMKRAASGGYATATDLADWLVLKLGLPFREAHQITGRIVALAETKGCDLKKLSLADFRSVEKRIGQEVFAVLDVDHALKSRKSHGGTAPANVKREARRWIKRLEKQGPHDKKGR